MQVQDPVCKMAVDPRRAAAQGTYDGRVVYFCSLACQKAFEETRPRRPA